MSSTTTDYTEERQRRAAQVGMDYVPTEEEKVLLKECNTESFIYRSVPFSVIGMAVTQALIARGALTASPRFGSTPKVLFAGFCGYLAGKLSYMKTCQEKFKTLENSPLGEMLRQRTGMPPQQSKGPRPEMSDAYAQSFDTMFQPAEPPSHMSPHTRDYGYGYSPDPPIQMGKPDDFSAPAQSFEEEDEPRKKTILYEDLRLKNRENYEVTLTQKAETLLKPTEREPARPKKEVKKNIYGDAWED